MRPPEDEIDDLEHELASAWRGRARADRALMVWRAGPGWLAFFVALVWRWR